MIILGRWIVGSLGVFAVAVVLAQPSSPSGDRYPRKPIRIILPFSGGSELIGRMLAARLTAVLGQLPYKSATFAITGALTGDVDMVIVVVSSAVPYIASGKIRGIAILNDRRNVTVANVPTSEEAGMAGLSAVNWCAVLAPAGTPQPIIDRLNAESLKMMSAAETRSSLAALGGEPASYSAEGTAQFLRAEYARWGTIIRHARIKTE